MIRTAVVALVLGLSSPVIAQTPRAPTPVTQAPASDTIALSHGMNVVSSDGVIVAKTEIGPPRTYTGDDSFFTKTLNPFHLRRVYPREAYVDGDVVRLRMTAAQFRARDQNPPPGV